MTHGQGTGQGPAETSARGTPAIEWLTVGLLVACYGFWWFGVTWLSGLWLPAGILVTAVAITLHSSLQHEVLHGHPTRNRLVNELFVFLPLGLVFPYGRFRDTHLEHHQDEHLTDPYDDPESNFQDPAVWARLSPLARSVLLFNNSLFGRMLIGPLIGVVVFIRGDIAAIMRGSRPILRDWLLHLLGLLCLFSLLRAATMPGWAYLLSAYAGMSILKIRTFLEHRAHTLARCRTVIIEGGRVLPFLFLNNNLHVVHHAKPTLAWYRLPDLYRSRREEFLRRNEGYSYASYGEVFRRYFFHAKDPVPHPLWQRRQ